MRDMWAFCGGPHYTMDFKEYENTKISNFLKKLKKKTIKRTLNLLQLVIG